MNPRRGTTTHSTWPSAVRENFHERPPEQPEGTELWAYSDRISYAPGETLRLHVSTTALSYDLRIERDGAQPRTLFERSGLPGTRHDTPADCSVTGCGWPVALEVPIPQDWPSGGYIATFRGEDSSGATVEHKHVFIVRPTDGAGEREQAGRLLLIAATSTWIAYNDWGGSNAYEGITGATSQDYSPRLSIRRPYSRGFAWLPVGAPRIPLREPPALGAAPRYPHMEWAYANGYSKKYASAGWASYERPFVCWAEAAGYRVDVASLHDLHFRPEILDGYACAVFVGHDEYWSWEMRDAVDRWVEAGGRAARFAGNFLWQVRLEDGGDTQVCYKYRARDEDPLRDDPERRHLTTTAWEASEVGRPGSGTFGLNAMRGVYAGWGNCCPRGAGGFTVYRPEHWAFAGSDLYYGDLVGAASRVFGYEVDGLDYGMRDGLPYPTGADGEPEGLEILAMGLATTLEADHGNAGAPLFIGEEDASFAAELLYGSRDPKAVARLGRGCGMMVSFDKGRGSVFHAGSVEWVAGLIDRDPFVERITRNVLDRFLE